MSEFYPLDISKYTWSAGFAGLFKRAGISFLNLGINDVTCEANNMIVKIPSECAPAVYTTLLGSIYQNGEFKVYEFYINNGKLATGLQLDNAHILLTGFWKTAIL